MAWKHIHLSPEAERGDEKEGRRKEGSGEGKNKKRSVQRYTVQRRQSPSEADVIRNVKN